MNKIKAEKKDRVFVYGNPYLNKYNKEDSLLLFEKSVDPELQEKNNNKPIYTSNTTNLLSNKKFDLNKITKSLPFTLFIVFNPNSSMALSYLNTLDKISSTGEDIISAFGIGVVKVVSIITVLRLLNELMNGGNEYRFFKILKECLGVILAIILIPRIPIIISMIVSK